MIIAAHAGTGKTRFAQTISDATDFICMPYKYYLPDGMMSCEESEQMKADLNLDIRDKWPDNYIKAVINQYNENRYVIIPPVMSVLAALRNEEIPYILCYPERAAKDEYERRYKERGNTEVFLDIFIGHWDGFLDQMESDPGKYHITMKSNEYLTDLLPQFDEIINREEEMISFELDAALLEKVNELYRETGFTIQTVMRRELIRLVKTGEIPKYMKVGERLDDILTSSN